MNFDYICTPKSARRVNSWVLCVCTGDDMWQAACSILAQKGTLKFQYISKHWPILFARARMSMIANGRHRCGFCCASGFGPLNTCFVRWPTGRMCLRISFSRTRRKASTMPSPPHLSSHSGSIGNTRRRNMCWWSSRTVRCPPPFPNTHAVPIRSDPKTPKHVTTQCTHISYTSATHESQTQGATSRTNPYTWCSYSHKHTNCSKS